MLRACKMYDKAFLFCSRGLLSMLQARGLPEATVWRYLVDILSAMTHLHALNLVHTDIKPENILIDRYGICKLGVLST